MAEQQQPRQQKGMNVKIGDEELKGRYSNLVRVTHTREEFVLDFINMIPPQGAVTARVITSPGHLKRLIRALDQVIPDHDNWLHDRIDNNAQAHIKSALLGPAETIPISDGDVLLGTWQSIMLVELDGPRQQRKISVTCVPSSSS